MSEMMNIPDIPAGGDASAVQFELTKLGQVNFPRDPEKPLVADTTASVGLEAYKTLRTRILRAQATRGFRTLAVTSAAQSDGKTLTSINLAFCCSELDDASVLLIDADLRTRGLTSLIGGKHVGLADVLAGEATYEQAIRKTDIPHLAFMNAGENDMSPAELFAKPTWAEFVRWASKNFKLVIVDSQPSGLVADFELIAAQCDGLLMVVRALRTSRADLEDALSALDAKKLVGVVWNGAQLSRKAYYYEPRNSY